MRKRKREKERRTCAQKLVISRGGRGGGETHRERGCQAGVKTGGVQISSSERAEGVNMSAGGTDGKLASRRFYRGKQRTALIEATRIVRAHDETGRVRTHVSRQRARRGARERAHTCEFVLSILFPVSTLPSELSPLPLSPFRLGGIYAFLSLRQKRKREEGAYRRMCS